MIKAEIIKDSVAPSGVRLTTYVLTYPRFIHSEIMTHRVFSRNASSSRAIPTAKFIEAIKVHPAMPNSFTKNQKGMQANEVVDQAKQERATELWLMARDLMLDIVQELSDLGIHKQHANRLLEPFQHITVVFTGTDFSNFFALRCHPDAQPEFQILANHMYDAYVKSTPNRLQNGEWHLPFIPDEWAFRVETIEEAVTTPSASGLTATDLLIRRSVARCARVSYNNHDGTNASVEKDLELYDRLLGGCPIHASPSEHQAMAVPDPNITSGNLRGWIQYRKTLTNENIKSFSKLT